MGGAGEGVAYGASVCEGVVEEAWRGDEGVEGGGEWEGPRGVEGMRL